MPRNAYWLHLIYQTKISLLNLLLPEEGERFILRNGIFLKFMHLNQSGQVKLKYHNINIC
jgi:hypothetical protein